MYYLHPEPPPVPVLPLVVAHHPVSVVGNCHFLAVDDGLHEKDKLQQKTKVRTFQG